MQIRNRSSRTNMFKLRNNKRGGGGSSPSRSTSMSSRSRGSKTSKKPHSPTNNQSHADSKEKTYPFKKFYPLDSALSLDVITLATYLQISSHTNPTIKFYDHVKDNPTFNAFYKLFNDLTGGLDKKLFSYLFFALVLHCSNNEDYSLKEYHQMFPELGFSEYEKDITKVLHGMSNEVLKELSESRSHKKKSSSSSKTSRASPSRAVVKTGGKRSNNRFKNKTMKYNQTGGFLYVIIAFLINIGIALGIPMRVGGRGLSIVLHLCVAIWALLAIWNCSQRVFNLNELFSHDVHNDLLPGLTHGFTAALTAAQALLPREARHTFNSAPEIATYNTTVANLPDNFRTFTSAENPHFGLSFPELVRVLGGNYEVVPQQQSRVRQFFTGFTHTREYAALQGHISQAFHNVGESFAAIVANTPLQEVPGPEERQPFFSWVVSTIRNAAIRLRNGQTVADDYAYNANNAQRIADYIASRSGQELQEAFRRMNHDVQRFINDGTARFGVIVDRQIFGIRQALAHLMFAAMGIWINLQ